MLPTGSLFSWKSVGRNKAPGWRIVYLQEEGLTYHHVEYTTIEEMYKQVLLAAEVADKGAKSGCDMRGEDFER